MIPGSHTAVVTKDSTIGNRSLGELRDTLLILLPGPTVLFGFLYRAPLSESTVAAQVLSNGRGGLWIDGCRIRFQSEADQASAKPQGAATGRPGRLAGKAQGGGSRVEFEAHQGAGRWPSNLVLVHHHECRSGTPIRIRSLGGPPAKRVHNAPNIIYGQGLAGLGQISYRQEGTETIPSWSCHSSCPVPWLDSQSGVSVSTGGRTRNITPSGVYGGGKGLGSSSLEISAEDVRGNPGFGDIGGASRYYPQFKNLAECLDWINRLINGAGHAT